MEGKYIILIGPESIQGSPAWKDFRHMKIGASMAPTLMGENPYQTKLELFEHILGGGEIFANSAMIRGNELEPKARKWFNEQVRGNFNPVVVQSVEYPWMIASLDGVQFSLSGNTQILEIKCGAKTFDEIAMGACPKQYWGQLQHQMMILGTKEAYLCAYDGEMGTHTTVLRDQPYIDKLFEAEKDFYQRLLDFNPPELQEEDYVEIKEDQAMMEAFEYNRLIADIKRLDQLKEEIRKKLISYAEGRRVRIGKLKICKTIKAGSIEYSKIPELEGVDLDKYRKPPTEFWTVK